MKNKFGFTLIEILVVIAIFAIIGLVASQSVVTTLRGSRKAEVQSRLRQNLDYALGIIQRNLYNGENVTCPAGNSSRIEFQDGDGNPQWIALTTVGTDQFIANTTNTNRLTSNEVRVTELTFTCTSGVGNAPPVVDIIVTAVDPLATGSEGASTTTVTKVVLRSNI